MFFPEFLFARIIEKRPNRQCRNYVRVGVNMLMDDRISSKSEFMVRRESAGSSAVVNATADKNGFIRPYLCIKQ